MGAGEGGWEGNFSSEDYRGKKKKLGEGEVGSETGVF